MRPDLRSVQRMAGISNNRFRLVRGLQLQVLINRERPWCISMAEPRGHGRVRRSVSLEELHRETAQRVAERLNGLLRSPKTCGIDDAPSSRRIDPRTRYSPSSERASAQLLSNAQ